MTCDAYYKDHPAEVPFIASTSTGASLFALDTSVAEDRALEFDRCAIRSIESSTALSISLLGASTTIFGVLNLFWTGSLIKRIGLKPTLMIQILFPAIRLFIQNIAVELGGTLGIYVFQLSQIVSVLGGPTGYVLVLNNFITEVVDHEARTAALGTLQGSMMFGSALGFLSGGLISDAFGIKAPFRLTLLLFLSSSAFVAVFLPHISPDESDEVDAKTYKPQRKGLARFFAPLAVFAPAKFIGRDNVIRTEYGSLLLACGVFLGINATGYIPTLLQLYSTDKFGFEPKENGWLIFLYSLLRGLFLTVAFPRIIRWGRKWTIRREVRARRKSEMIEERGRLLPPPNDIAKMRDSPPDKEEQAFVFDLHYTQFSLIADGLLTLLCSFTREGWQMYLVAIVLPFAAGTSSAAKGTILQMMGSSATSNERTDALAGVSLVENIARLSTSALSTPYANMVRMLTPGATAFIFGVIFAAFASVDKLELVFVCNAVSVHSVRDIFIYGGPC